MIFRDYDQQIYFIIEEGASWQMDMWTVYLRSRVPRRERSPPCACGTRWHSSGRTFSRSRSSPSPAPWASLRRPGRTPCRLKQDITFLVFRVSYSIHVFAVLLKQLSRRSSPGSGPDAIRQVGGNWHQPGVQNVSHFGVSCRVDL